MSLVTSSPTKTDDVAASRQSAANVTGILDGGFLPKAATQLISGCPVGTNAAAKGSLGWTFGAFGV